VLRFAGQAPVAGKLPHAGRARIAGATLADAERLTRAAEPEELELDLDDYTGLAERLGPDGTLFGKRLLRCYTGSPAEMTRLLAVDASFEVVTYLTKQTEPAVRALSPEGAPPPARLALAQKNYDLVSLCHENDVDTKAFFASYPHPVPVENVPACVLGRAPRPHPRTLDVQMLGADARIDMAAYTRRYVADAYYTKAVRCGTCAVNAECRGVHVNWVRAHGFAPLDPVRPASPVTSRRDDAPAAPIADAAE
jgi:hypothetical protein